MKKILLLCLMLMMTGSMIVLTGCSDDEDDQVTTCTDGVQNGDETGVDCGGTDCDPCTSCTDGIQNGNETGIDCGGADCDPCQVGIQGSWQSSGDNIAPLLVSLTMADSIWIDFRTNGTYTVEQYDVSGAKLTLEGTYAQSESSVSGIWDITVNQSSPSALTSAGIFSINGDIMQYEIVQTDPDIGATPPTAAAGFGSTNGGAIGDSNIQKYERIE